MVFNSQQLNDEEKGKRSDTVYKKKCILFCSSYSHILYLWKKRNCVESGFFRRKFCYICSSILLSPALQCSIHCCHSQSSNKYKTKIQVNPWISKKNVPLKLENQKRCFASTGDLEISYDLPVCVCYASCDKIVLKTLAFLHRYTQKQGSAQR